MLKPLAAFIKYTIQPLLEHLERIIMHLKESGMSKEDFYKVSNKLYKVYTMYAVIWALTYLLIATIVIGAVILCFNG